VTAVEFALLMPVLIIVVMGIIEFSMILYTYNTCGLASRDVTRRVATNRLTAANASTSVTQQLPLWVRNSTTVTVTQTTPSAPATNQITVNVSFPTSKATPINYLSSVYGSSALQTATTMQQETAP
jgi:Flp pilus assembly protein TadG